MAWGEVEVIEQRIKFIKECLENKLSMAELCRIYQISPKNGYKWLNRYQTEGLEGLKDKSRAPHNQSSKINNEITQDILDVRFQFPSWGPKKVLSFLEREKPGKLWPSTTTIGNIFDRNGLTVPRKLRRRMAARTEPLSHCIVPNDVWCADFKGWFLTKDGSKCEPFTLTDGTSRYLLRCVNLERNNTEHGWGVLEAAFRQYGLPLYFRSDNGPPFATCGVGRLSKLSVKMIKAGVIPEWIDPGEPQQNGRHERMHQTLKNETANPPGSNLEEQSKRFKTFQNYYNNIRPHEGIEQKTPGSIYTNSLRRWNGRLKTPEYNEGMIVRKVREKGQISLKPFAADVLVGSALGGEYVGVEEVEDGVYEVRYGPLILGKIDHTKKLVISTCKPRRRTY
jgi:putative transposase